MRLNLGCGGQVADGWVNIDRAGDPPVVVHDLRDPLPFPDGSVAMAVAHHVLDLLEERDLRAVLAEVHRVLEPAGVLRVSTIDITKSLRAVRDDDIDWFTAKGIPGDTVNDAAAWWLDCGGARKTILTTRGKLAGLLADAGFACTYVGFEETTTKPRICELDSREDESFFVEATKP